MKFNHIGTVLGSFDLHSVTPRFPTYGPMKNLRYLAAVTLVCALSGAQASAPDRDTHPQAMAARAGDVTGQSAPHAGAPLPVAEWLMLTGGLGLLGAARRRRQAA